MADKIRYGVTLYSYSNEYVNGILSFEEILRTVKAQGYTGIELVASQMAGPAQGPAGGDWPGASVLECLHRHGYPL